ncbi:conserved hypothetical protein [Talaromyces stipitatus ATCC 10500]|uniref:Zn(2)-C6 fungal-type domain-containing protein n=1 Tax=Talaromyces stipitatus (strain ATCC 10500 / CBS 375.48 / QM 6759 / NRRL 1006) TaxID=441959 RepID=B8MB09_TALSN|nr:uncharacterized protein TSTA_124340 [Talaromyces stipitatus ATCC 10500]EED18710.1 conserved hypothetical protein [Talaromyces stipitatus ATCC 10500]
MSEAAHEHGKPKRRRARYALRACDECKRRKGRCDGDSPCAYCRRRSIECHYDEDPRFLSNCACGGSCSTHYPKESIAYGNRGNISEIERLTGLVENMQKQIDILVDVRMSQKNEQKQDHSYTVFESHKHADLSPVKSSNNHQRPDYPTPDKDMPLFCGATSSEYTFNVAERNITATQHQGKSPKPNSTSKHSPHFVEKQSSHNNRNSSIENRPSNKKSQGSGACFCEDCLRALRTLTKDEALRLVYTYEDVVGNLHPFLNQERFKSQVEAIYTALESKQEIKTGRLWNIDADDMDNIKVALAIALLALSIGNSEIGVSLYASVQDKIHNAVFSPIKNPRKLVLLLLVGMYHYFHDDLQLAWRTCGIAGKVAMEMGLHRQDALHMIEDVSDRAEVVNILWNIVVLDKQWSCAAGLPHHFTRNGFAKILPEPLENPYLKIMASYAPFHTRFWDFSGTMRTAGACEDEDLFDSCNYQIEQWRKRSLADLDFLHPKIRRISTPASLPQPVSTLLYLRANQIRGLTIRSVYLSGSSLAGSRHIVKSGIEIACDTIDVLADLDATTDIYAKQHPFFQHFLTSAVALLLLVIASESKRNTLYKIISDLSSSVDLGESISRAFSLNASYFTVSGASRRLFKRMISMAEPLSKLGIFYPTGFTNKDLTHLSLQHQVDSGARGNPQEYPQNNALLLLKGTANLSSPFNNIPQHEVYPDIFTTEGASGMVQSMSAPYSLMDTNYDVFQGFESMIDDRTWMELGALFSFNPQ